MERFAAGMAASRCGVHGPYASGEALSVSVAVAAERAEGGSVAFGVGDELLVALDIVALDIEAQLVAAGVVPLRSDSPHWADALGTAGAGLTGSVLGMCRSCRGCGDLWNRSTTRDEPSSSRARVRRACEHDRRLLRCGARASRCDRPASKCGDVDRRSKPNR